MVWTQIKMSTVQILLLAFLYEQCCQVDYWSKYIYLEYNRTVEFRFHFSLKCFNYLLSFWDSSTLFWKFSVRVLKVWNLFQFSKFITFSNDNTRFTTKEIAECRILQVSIRSQEVSEILLKKMSEIFPSTQPHSFDYLLSLLLTF